MKEPCVPNSNVSKATQDLLMWHERLAHVHFSKLQKLARAGYLPKHIATCDIPICASCQFGKAHKRNKMDGQNNKIGSKNATKPGDLVHMDQAESSTPGRPLTFSGKNNPEKVFIITIFVDHISKKVFVEFQHTTSSQETLKSKARMEMEAYKDKVKIKAFHADNGFFKAQHFRLQLEEKGQYISFCGVGAHHQNGTAERFICTIVERARTSLLHAYAHWSIHIKMELWTFSVRYIIDQWNNTPHNDLDFQTPNEVFSNTNLDKSTSEKLKRYNRLPLFHTFGCPVYVLDAKAQDNKRHINGCLKLELESSWVIQGLMQALYLGF